MKRYIRNTELPLPKSDSINMKPIKDALGPDSPHITPTALGRYRLTSTLRNKYGSNYKNNPDAAKLLNHFDDQMEHAKNLYKISRGDK